MTAPVHIFFADLKHAEHSCNAIPYGIGMVAAYARQMFGPLLAVELFKEVDDLAARMADQVPQIVCFSNYIWNSELGGSIARRIKACAPRTVIVAGGPNYPLAAAARQAYLNARPWLDFYICREGELAFAALVQTLLDAQLDAVAVRRTRCALPNCQYVDGDDLISGPLLPRISALDALPSPYLTGLCDQFLRAPLVPLIQTARGCPFACTYCHEGHRYFNQLQRFSAARIRAEIEYIAARTQVPNLMLADSNFGMYAEDLEICRAVADIQRDHGYPRYFMDISGKNHKQRVRAAAEIIKGAFVIASIQSTDRTVLRNIKRANVAQTQMLELAAHSGQAGANSFSEIILCLPGDTKAAHITSMCDMIDAGMAVIRSHQFIMLPGSAAASAASRRQYRMTTRFRVTPKTVHRYTVLGAPLVAPEIDEICVANATMPFVDYLESRQFDLTVEIFYNDGILYELLQFLKRRTITGAVFIRAVHECVRSASAALATVYREFVRETQELYATRAELQARLCEPAFVAAHMEGAMGNNEQLRYRTQALLLHMDAVHRVAYDTARALLGHAGAAGADDERYLKELMRYSVLRKSALLSYQRRFTRMFHYDFSALLACGFEADPRDFARPSGCVLCFAHSPDQQHMIARYLALRGDSDYGRSNIISNTAHLSALYRTVTPPATRAGSAAAAA